MNQKRTFAELREQAIALRRAGRSRREIRDLLAITSNEILNEALRDEPPQLQNLQLHIHESGEIEAAQRFWMDMTGLHTAQFRRPALKRHNPSTVRKNTGDRYHGCLRIEVLRSVELYRQIDGWATAAMAEPDTQRGSG